MTDKTEQLANDVTRSMLNIPKLSDLDPDETISRRLKWFNHPRKDSSGFAISAAFGTGYEWSNLLESELEHRLDKRKLKADGTTIIGKIVFDKDGSVVDYSVDSDYLKPSEQE